MCEYTENQIRLQNEMAVLAGCYAQLRDLWLENQSPHLVSALEAVLKRLKIAEKELDANIEAQDINETFPVITLASKKARL